MKVVYLTWGETPRSYGVFNSQVINQFVETKKIMPDSEFVFMSAVPIIHSGMVREKWAYHKELKKVKQNLNGIDFLRIPIFLPQTVIYIPKLIFLLKKYGALGRLANKLKKENPDIIHCRGYVATYFALKAREIYQLNYKVIFDARGLFPEETALKKEYSNNSKAYLFLKKIEKYNLDHSDRVITVSDPMKGFYLKLTRTPIINIYLSATISESEKPINMHNKEKVLIYVGALSDGTWHKPKSLVELYAHFKSLFNKTKLIIVTTSNHEDLKSRFEQFSPNEIEITSTRTEKALREKLAQADFSCLPYFTPKKENEKLISKTVLAVKTVEYLSAGLPMLCNKYCGGAAMFVDRHGVGVTYDPNNMADINRDNLTRLLNPSVVDNCIKISKENFEYSINAKKYSATYKSLLRKD